MFKHHSAAINRFAIATMTEITIYRCKLETGDALFRMKMLIFVVGVDDALAAVAPNNEQIACLRIDFSGHKLMR